MVVFSPAGRITASVRLGRFLLFACLLALCTALPAWSAATTLSAVAFSTNVSSPQQLGTSILLTATATGGTSVQYQFWVYNANATPAWSQLQAYSSSATCLWTPTASGSYYLSATAMDNSSGIVVNQTLWYTIIAGLSALSVSAAPLSPQPVGMPITFTATATGGTNVQYQYWLYNANATPAWQQLQPYSAQASYTWTPLQVGNYLLSVTARDSSGIIVNDMLWYTIGIPLSALSFSMTPAPPQPAYTAITFTAQATGGSGVQYQFWLYNKNTSTWSPLRGYSTQPACTWTPQAEGDYLLSITALDSTGSFLNTQFWYTVTAGLTDVTVTASPASPQPANTPITFTAAATGGGNVQYQFWLYSTNANSTWTQMQAYSFSPTWTWTPAASGNYLISVTAQDSSGTRVNTLLWYTVGTAPLSVLLVTTTPATSPIVNNPVKISAVAIGGSNITYQFWLYNANATPAWSQLQVYSSSSTCTWTPTTAGSYLISVTALDTPTNTAVNTMIWCTVIVPPPLSAVTLTTTPAATQTVNAPVTLTAAATGGTSVVYQFNLSSATGTPAWSQLQAYSSSSTCTWTPTVTGSYLLSVTAKDTPTGTLVTSAPLSFTVLNPPLSAVTIGVSPAATQTVNAPVTITAGATGGTSVVYQFNLSSATGTPAWSQLQAYSSASTCTWTPTAAGSYLLAVTAKDTSSGTQVTSASLPFTVLNPLLSAVTIGASPAATQTVNAPVTLTAAATGGTSVVYQFNLSSATGTPAWSQLQAYSSSSTCVWTPTAAGSYLLAVTAKDTSTGTLVTSASLPYTITASAPAAGTLTGTVMAAGTPQTTLNGATVTVVGLPPLTATSINGGNFSIANVPLGAQTLLVSCAGYVTLRVPVTVIAGNNPVTHPGADAGPIQMDGTGVYGCR